MKEFAKLLRKKGWSVTELSKRWDLCQSRIRQISADPKQKDWDAAEGLPYKEECND